MKVQVSLGEFVPTDKYDILCKASNKDDHPGRMRGYSTHTCQRDVFEATSSCEDREKSKYNELVKELAMTKQMMFNAVKWFAKCNGMTLPNNLEDLNSNWEPPSNGSHQSSVKVVVDQNDPIPETESNEMAQQLKPPQTVSIFFIMYFLYEFVTII